jgi:serine/threonine-protein kinase RsbW
MTAVTTTSSEAYLALPARPENVAVVRQSLAGVAEAMNVEVALLSDMKIAVTEACTNAVLHAYDGFEGSLEIVLRAEDTALTISVRDRGPGFKPLPAEHDEAPLGFGLALIASLADAFSIQGSAAGTEVQMTFDVHPEGGNGSPPPAAGQLATRRPPPPDETVLLGIAHGPLVQPVLGRVISMLAARVDFSIDRLSDAQIVSDALAQHAGEQTTNGLVAVRIDEGDRRLDLEVGPLVRGGGERLVAATELPGLGRLLPQLASDLSISASDDDDAESLRLRLTETDGD